MKPKRSTRVDPARRGGCVRFARSVLLGLLCLGLSAPVGRAATAQTAGPSSTDRSRDPDFLFGAPRGSLAVYGGWSFASASSGIFDFVREELTVGGRDFDAPMVGIDLSYDINPRIAAALRFEYGKASVRSEFREWVDQDDNPIEQTSELMKIPLTGNMKVYLSPRGREISRYAWIPYSVAPYVGGGGGVIYYRFEQYGDFVDFDDLSIFSDRFQSSGWALIVQAFGGVDIKLHRRFFLNIEAGYGWAEAELSQDFVDFDPIDLAGFRISGGINVLL